MEPTLSSETSAFILKTPGKFQKEHGLHSKHGESLKTTKNYYVSYNIRFVVLSGLVFVAIEIDPPIIV